MHTTTPRFDEPSFFFRVDLTVRVETCPAVHNSHHRFQRILAINFCLSIPNQLLHVVGSKILLEPDLSTWKLKNSERLVF